MSASMFGFSPGVFYMDRVIVRLSDNASMNYAPRIYGCSCLFDSCPVCHMLCVSYF